MSKPEDSIIINSRKYDNKIHKTWKAKFIREENSLLIFSGVFESEINHPILGIIRRGTISEEFYWLNQWFNVFRFLESDGSFRNFYCNINMPPKFDNDILDYVDLDIDVLVHKDFSYDILDVDEYQRNTVKYNYSNYLVQNVELALNDLLNKINKREFPFEPFSLTSELCFR